MAVAFDNTASISGTAVTTLTTPSFTITSNANRAALLGVSLSTRSNSQVFSGSVGGVSAVNVAGTYLIGNSGDNGQVNMLAVTAPPAGSQTATASWVGFAADAVLGIVTASGVDQTTPVNNGTAADVTASPFQLSIT